MKVIPYQVQFNSPIIEEGDKRSTRYGEPDISTLIESKPDKKGVYVFHTHERSGSCEPGKYYQIVFRIADPAPFRMNELSLSLDRRIYCNSEEPVSNDLYYDRKADLWYQRAKYVKKENGNWELNSENKKSSLNVESITASGVFKISVMRNGEYLSSPEYEIPWIYVLPSSVSLDDYATMLSDLLKLNERLIKKEGSSVGVGKMSAVEIQSAEFKQDIENTEKLRTAIINAMKLPSELLGKNYTKTTINKTKHFGSKTVRDYIKYGMTGRVSGVEYFENHDTYENRVIKYVLLSIKRRLDNEALSSIHVKTEKEIEEETEERLKVHLSLLRNAVRIVYISQEEEIRETIKGDICRKNECEKRRKELLNSQKKAVKLLDDDWFKNIENLPNLNYIRATPKFVSNRYYSEIYRLITGSFIDKPFISSSFDINAFGVASTHQVYEYWVLYKLISHLMALGFEMTSGKKLREHFVKFKKNQTLSQMIIPMQRKDEKNKQILKIELGYNVTFTGNNIKTGETLNRTPDYYIKVFDKDEVNWYFLDAKYKSFCDKEGDRQKVYYADEVYNVAVKKYIDDLGMIFDTNPKYSSKHYNIRGSYIIMADIDDTRPLEMNDRLFCKSNEMKDREQERLQEKHDFISYIINKNAPAHQYGAIKLTPGNDDELTSLFMLIFEYLETQGKKDHENFNWCWKCDSTQVDNIESATEGGHKKFYTTCPKCGDFRVITNCQNSYGKHMIIKHAEGNFHYRLNQSWAFVCPRCGSGL